MNKYKNIVLKNNENKINSNLNIAKGVEPFSFSRFGVNNMKLKTLKRIEDIRNIYITNKNNIKYDETLDIAPPEKIYENLDIEALDNYTYISTDAMIDKINRINANSNKMLLNIFINAALLVLLILVNIGLVFEYYYAENLTENSKFDVNKFFIMLFIGIIIIDFLIYYFICLFISFFISKFYGYKNMSCIKKIFYNLIFEKYIRYLYRMRLLINKYKKEFNFIDK